MARYYLWTLRRRFTAKYLLAWQRSVGVFSFFNLKLQGISIIVNGASLNAQGIFYSLFMRQKKLLLDLLKSGTR